MPGHRGEQNQWGGRTWYRKTFTLPESYKGKKVYIEFEGVRQVAEVYLNGQLLGVSKTGFTPFGFDLTPHLRFGARQRPGGDVRQPLYEGSPGQGNSATPASERPQKRRRFGFEHCSSAQPVLGPSFCNGE